MPPPKPNTKKAAARNSSSDNDNNLSVVPPPLYPPATRPAPLNPEVMDAVKTYSRLANHFRTNFSVEVARNSGFQVERYTDQYKLTLKPHLSHRLPDSVFPAELSAKKPGRKRVGGGKLVKVEDLPDVDEKQAPPPQVNQEKEEDKEEDNSDDDDVDDEDIDEEMDKDTDYNKLYFDTGDGDEEDRQEDEGPTY